jgi:hypothetical protein
VIEVEVVAAAALDALTAVAAPDRQFHLPPPSTDALVPRPADR